MTAIRHDFPAPLTWRLCQALTGSDYTISIPLHFLCQQISLPQAEQIAPPHVSHPLFLIIHEMVFLICLQVSSSAEVLWLFCLLWLFPPLSHL